MIKSICFLTTYQCNAQCDYCECGPRSKKERLGLADIIRLIDEAKGLGTVGQVVFSGGEPTLLGNNLFTAIRHAAQLGMLTRLVTNGWWGTSRDKAQVFLNRLIEAGLYEINISVDDLHQRWIDLAHVRNSFLACYERKFKCLIAHKQMRNAKITQKYLESYFGVELVEFVPGKVYAEDEECRLISSGPVVPVGRNEEYVDWSELVYSPWTGNCSSVLKDIIIGANCNLLPCCGIVSKNIPELTRNDLRKTPLIEAIDQANNDLILNWLALEGPAAMARFVRERDHSISFRDFYVGICHICNDVLTREDVRATLSAHIDEVVERVSLHRDFFEKARSNEKIMEHYCRLG